MAAAVSIQAAAGDLAPKLAAASAEPLVYRSPDASARDDVAPGAMPGGRSTMTASVKGGGNTAQGPCVELSCRSAQAKPRIGAVNRADRKSDFKQPNEVCYFAVRLMERMI